MRQLALTDLRSVLEGVAGEAEDVTWDESVLDVPFDELGYDSLALVGVIAAVRRDSGAAIPEEAIVTMQTPRAALATLNDHLSLSTA
jgi:act minimal PKS acyl carrier protein